ncbi:STE/STE20/SLK protein kinase [Salpingoeca rosetta]|uniref:STE/STE20/SLK protein kinase n=1 Tax=Salpingoeca rosetta (strain ATCC 50818 / BSB-021) TaxID=946362 RepID=F2UMT3_SALR5|nr:STE/STE20/SLK protein kinase [Salpingoeca rosetta]EGD78432.1 STE/STE20/SLK protein kinase [Salpingoeca rosetta]|eukprot:XP_004989381.1 STE/STE20/SLK protein kinase [Salpingoeca rosetta]
MGAGGGKLRHVKKESPINTWMLQETLGSGSYGKVHKVRNRATGELAAAKVAPIQAQEELQNFATEIEILTSCKHRNITNFMDAYYNNNELWILLEVCDAGSLAEYVEKQPTGLPEDAMECIAHQMVKGIRFSCMAAASSIAISTPATPSSLDGMAKLAGFGVSAFNKQDGAKRNTFVGSLHWMAPEVIVCEHDRKAKCDSLWMSNIDPFGWFQWYCRFYLGRRSSDDARQISRAKKCFGETGRWRINLCNKIMRASGRFDDTRVGPVVRQTLLHWGHELTKRDYDKHVKKYAKKQ